MAVNDVEGKVFMMDSAIKDWAMRKYDKKTHWAEIIENHIRVDKSAASVYEDIVSTGEPLTKVAYSTTFVNNSKNEQSSTFRTERSMQSTCLWSLVKGLSFTTGVNLSLGYDSTGLGFEKTQSKTTMVGETTQFEQSKTLSIEASITIPPNCRVQVDLLVHEKETFTKYTDYFILKGRVVVQIKKIHRNSPSGMVVTRNSGEVFDVFMGRDKMFTGTPAMEVDGSDVESIVKFQNSGVYRSTQSLHQDVIVHKPVPIKPSV